MKLDQMKLLVVEDYAITRKMIVKSLKEIGFQRIFEANDGESATQILAQENDIRLIISDWNMPNMDGFQLLLWARSNKDYKHIPFIMATAQGEKEQAMKALEAGADNFLIKPFDKKELESTIKKSLTWDEPTESTDDANQISSMASASSKADIHVAHIQITDHLIIGVLRKLIHIGELTPKYFNLHLHCMGSWNPVQHALETGDVQAALILAPMAMDMFGFGVPIRLILFAHKNGSICVRSKRSLKHTPSLHQFLKSKTFYLPHTMSVHHILADMFLREIGLNLGPVGKPGTDVFFEVVPPIRMPEFLLANPDSCGFIVAEPLGTKSISEGISDLLFLSGEIWENHPCCVVTVREDFIKAHPDAVHEFTEMLVYAGRFISENPDRAATIAAAFLDPDRKLGLNHTLLKTVLTMPKGIRTDDLFPILDDLDSIQKYMVDNLKIGRIIDINAFANLNFAEAAYSDFPSDRRESVIQSPSFVITRSLQQQKPRQQQTLITKPSEDSISPIRLFEITGDDTSITFRISSEMELVHRVVENSREFLRQFGFEHFSEFKLILRELLNNAIEHGNKKINTRKATCTVQQIQDTLFKITVEDEGDGFDYRSLNMSVPEDSRQIRSRGYPLIHALSEKIEFNQKGNKISVFIGLYKETQFDIEKKGDHVIISPSGDITAPVADQFRSLLLNLVKEGYHRFKFDLKRVQDMDSVSLSVLIVLEKMLLNQKKSPDLEIINANRDLMDLFRLTHMNKTYRIVSIK